MEFFENFLKIWRKFKNILLCGKKRERSEDMMREDENMFFSIKKRRLSESVFPSKRIFLKENSLNIGDKRASSLYELKEKIKNKSSQADVIFANEYLTQKLLKIRNNTMEEENIIQTDSEVLEEQNFAEEISPTKDDNKIIINEDTNFAKFTFKKIKQMDLISEGGRSFASKVSKPSIKENQIAPRGAIIEREVKLQRDINNINDLCYNNDNNQPSYVDIIKNINEVESENIKNPKEKFSFLRILEDKEESKVSAPNDLDYLEEYNELIKYATQKSDVNNFPIFGYSQFKILNE
jgi:hypothetical protein